MILNHRKLENIHILFWLIKDTCWMMQFKAAGTFMIIPTVLMAIWITWVSREKKLHLWPNLAVLCWICANGLWMMNEFFAWQVIPLALSLFCLGLIFISIYIYTILPSSKARLRKP